jgi:hypothetical protein
MEFSVGQRVVCVDTKPGKDTGAPVLLAYLREGSIYTVRSLEAFPGQEDFPTLRLEEVICPTIKTSHGPWEIGFAPTRFRPVRPTSIEVFREMLVSASSPLESESDAQMKGT